MFVRKFPCGAIVVWFTNAAGDGGARMGGGGGGGIDGGALASSGALPVFDAASADCRLKPATTLCGDSY